MRLYEIIDTAAPLDGPGAYRRVSLQWTMGAAERSVDDGEFARMRTVPRLLRPLLRLVWW